MKLFACLMGAMLLSSVSQAGFDSTPCGQTSPPFQAVAVHCSERIPSNPQLVNKMHSVSFNLKNHGTWSGSVSLANPVYRVTTKELTLTNPGDNYDAQAVISSDMKSLEVVAYGQRGRFTSGEVVREWFEDGGKKCVEYRSDLYSRAIGRVGRRHICCCLMTPTVLLSATRTGCGCRSGSILPHSSQIPSVACLRSVVGATRPAPASR
ncbi:MAG: hypothetical protein J3Q66DRAFT_366639 [Benniella sp.]|nr:MAG: hypothetical protein J3Q66DRAFT_366639 [Benniella sp.]